MCVSSKTIKYSIFPLIFLGLLITEARATGKYPIKNFSPEEYKAGIQNIDFAQNRDMDLYIANNLGVLCFNGDQWEVYAYNTGKKQRSLSFDESTNRLYVGSQGDFGYFEGNWQYFSLFDKVPEEYRAFDEVWDVFIHDSKIYFCTFLALYVYDGQAVSVIQNTTGFNRSFKSGSRLFTQTPQGVIQEIDNKRIISNIPQLYSNQIVTGIIPHMNGQLVFYNSGKIEFSTANDVHEELQELADSIAGSYVNHVLQLSDSRLIISTQRAGLFIYDFQSDVIEYINTKSGLLSNACLRTFQDYNGNLWVGMQNGIAMIDINSPIKIYNEDIGLQGSGYEVFESDEGTYYSTSNGIYFRVSGGSTSAFIEGTEGPAYGIHEIEDRIYSGHHTGLFLLDRGRATRIASTNGIWNVKELQTKPGYVLGGTYSGLQLFKTDGQGRLRSISKIDGFNESSRFFEEDRKGSIWVGQYYKGLYQLELNEKLTKVSVIKSPEDFSAEIGKNIILSRINEELYIGTNRGIFKVDQSSNQITSNTNFAETVGNQWIYTIAQDKQKNIFLYSEELVGFFNQVSSTNFSYIPSSLFQLKQSFNNDLLTVSTNVNQGVYFNANEGFIYYNPELEGMSRQAKKPLIERVYSLAEDSVLYSKSPFANRQDNIEPISIIQGTKVLKFYVESFSYKDLNNRQFRYYLEGFDDTYDDWSNVTFKEYTNLKEGNYEFFVQTNNHLGVIATSIPIRIEVRPPFYKSTLAKLFYALLVAALLSWIYRIQRQYYRKKQKRLNEVKKAELTAKHEELKKLKEEKTVDELRHLNNLLAASTMNLVVKNEFMENIKEEIKQVKQSGKSGDIQKSLQKIIKEIDTTLKVQEDWKQFEYHFDRVHGDFLTRLTNEFLDLTPGEQKLCAFLRLKMDTKEIANLMGISLRGVEVARYRLRKKLGLEKHQNLSKFVLEY